MRNKKRELILAALAVVALAALAVYRWQDSQLIQQHDLAVHCSGRSCNYQVRLANPGPLQGTQLIWVAHKVTQDKGDVFSWIHKNTEEVAGEKVYMTAGSKRSVAGSFTKPRYTSYVVLKLRPVE